MAQISIIVPVYNVEQFLKRCVDSILGQSFSDFELILIDDGSPDNCGKMCDEYAKADRRIHVIHQENRGLSEARNAGLDWAFQNSESEWVAFIDSDDWIHPDYLQTLYVAAKEHQVDIAICGFQRTNGLETEDIPAESEIMVTNPEWMWWNNQMTSTAAWCKLMKKRLYSNIRFPAGLIYEDEYTTYRALFQVDRLAFINKKMYYYFINPKGITGVAWSEKRLDSLNALQQQSDYFKRNGYKKAYQRSVKGYLNRLHDSVDTIKKIDIENGQELVVQLEKRLKKDLWKYGISGEYLPREWTGRFYRMVFSVRVDFFKKLKKKLSYVPELFRSKK